MVFLYEAAAWGGLTFVLNLTIALLALAVSDRWGCPK
jgi:hypothetical protein